MATIPATEKQLKFLEQLTSRDYSKEELTASEASKKIEKALANKGKEVAEANLPPQDKGKLLAEDQKIIDEALRGKPSGQEVGMWWKQLGDDLRSGHIDKSTPQGKLLRAAYFAQMFSILNIKMGDKKEE